MEVVSSALVSRHAGGRVAKVVFGIGARAPSPLVVPLGICEHWGCGSGHLLDDLKMMGTCIMVGPDYKSYRVDFASFRLI